MSLVAKLFSAVRCEGTERLPVGPCVLCFSHQNWADPFYVFTVVPKNRRLYFFGPKEEEMRRGFRNRWMRWGGVVIPYRPGQRGLVAATARAHALLVASAVVAIAGEGRIHVGEGTILPLNRGPAYLSMRSGVPLVPVAINGTGWLGFRRVVRVRVGIPMSAVPETAGRPTAAEVNALTARAQSALELLVADFPDQPPPRRAMRWLTELFNDWPDGQRPTARVD